MSEQVERRLLEILDHPTESPYGNPIPALDELGAEPAGRFLEGVVSIVDVVAGSDAPVAGTIRRLGEPVQFDPELLSQLQSAGVVPGALVTLAHADGYVAVQAEGHEDGLELPREIAAHVYIAA